MRSAILPALVVMLGAATASAVTPWLRLLESPPAPPAAPALAPDKLEELEATLRNHVDQGHLPGGIIWIERRGEAHQVVYGWKSLQPRLQPLELGAVFDVASLTKVVATTPAILQLAERGRIDLDAPVERYVPEFAGEGREAVTVRSLLTHTSGLPPGIPHDARRPWSGYDEGIRRACAEPLRYTPGTDFVYSDINFILLGEIVQRTAGRSLHDYCVRNIFRPLGMNETGFIPPAGLRERAAPTTLPLQGEVHDPTSRRMGGVCGHAGLFSTAHDLARYCRMLLNRGILDGRRVLEPSTIEMMARQQTPGTLEARRGLGWDLRTRFTHQRGDYFPDGSFGHTGWTGPSLWIDPASQTFIVFLTNRNHPTEKGSTGRLRHHLGTLAAEAAADWQWVVLPGVTLPMPQAHQQMLPVAAPASRGVLNGIDVLQRDGFRQLAGLRLGLITNHTGINRRGETTIDLLAQAPEADLRALFSPEHGIRGELDQSNISDSRDEKTGLPIYSLYGKTRSPQPEHLEDLDALVFDIQDIGCRFYTYISTMSLAMQAAEKAGKKFIVLDRVNPINGVDVEGPLREGADSFTAAHVIPLRHGMTVGELARMMAAERRWKVDLQVVPCENWRRGMFFDETGLPWVNPSPNMRSLTAALLYPGVGLLEFTNISVGRGTDIPFEWIGAPWIDGEALVRELNAAGLEGINFTPAEFTPVSSVHKGELCRGVRFTLTDREKFRPTALGAALGSALCRLFPQDYKAENLNRLLVHEPTLQAMKAGRPAREIVERWQADERQFLLRRRDFLLY